MPDSQRFMTCGCVAALLVGAALSVVVFHGRHPDGDGFAGLMVILAFAVWRLPRLVLADAAPAALGTAFCILLMLPLFHLMAGLAAVAGYVLPGWTMLAAAALLLAALRLVRRRDAEAYRSAPLSRPRLAAYSGAE